MPRLINFARLFLILCNLSKADTLPPVPAELSKSTQLLLVIAPSWDTPYGALQSFQRNDARGKWVATGESIPIVMGKNGMGWGVDLQKYHLPGPSKKEGDLKSPVGVFKIGPLFGFAA